MTILKFLEAKSIKSLLYKKAARSVHALHAPLNEALDKKIVGAIFKDIAKAFAKTTGDEKAAKMVVSKVSKKYKSNSAELSSAIKQFMG